MRLLSAQLADFQSYTKAVSIRFARDITVLAGRNNVGKSAFLRSLRLPVEPQNIGPGLSMQWQWTLEPADIDAAFGQDLRERMTGGTPIESARTLTFELSVTPPSLTSPPVGGADPGAPGRIGNLFLIRSTLDVAEMGVVSYMGAGMPRLVFG